MKPFEQLPRSAEAADIRGFLDQPSSVPIQDALGTLEELSGHPDASFRGRVLDGLERAAPERVEAMALRFLEDPAVARMLASDPGECLRSLATFDLRVFGDHTAELSPSQCTKQNVPNHGLAGHASRKVPATTRIRRSPRLEEPERTHVGR
jgi:hypothetical protein